MKHYLLISILTLFSLEGISSSWVQKTSMPATARSYTNSFVIDGKAYLGGGYDSHFVYQSDFWEYDPATDSWTQKASLQNSISGAGCFTINRLGYLVNGWINGSNSNDVYEYDAVNNTWTLKNPFPGPGRYLSCAFEINGIGYIGLGFDPFLADFWSYNASTDSWTALAAFPGTARQAAFSFAINGIGYVGGGTDTSTYAGRDDFWSYDPGTNTWTQLGNFIGRQRHSAVAFVCSGKAYVGTGIDGNVGGNFYNDFYEFEPNHAVWTLIDSFPGGVRGSATAFSINDCGYVFGGAYFPTGSGTFYNDLWSYCLTTGVSETDAHKINIQFNSSKQLVRVDCGNYPLNNGMIYIYDIQGKCVLSSAITQNQMELPFANHALGIYTYRVNDNEKLIKSGRFGM